MRALCVTLVALLTGCNQLFGLDAPRAVDAADVDDGDADVDDGDGGGIDGRDDGDARPPGTPGTVWALNVDVVTPAGAVHGYEAHPAFGYPPEDCVLLASEGGCRTERCMTRSQQLPVPHSGTVTVDAQRLLAMDPDNNGLYGTPAGVDGGFFDAGTTIGVYSTGAGVPVFSTVLDAPPIVTFTAPTLPSPTSPATITRAAGISFTYTPASAAVTIFLIISDAQGARTYCNLAASGGSAAVSPNALNPLTAGAGSFYAYTVASTTTPAGASYDILVTAAQAARRSDNDWARGTITIQ